MLPRIEAIRAELRPSERKLADYILAAPREVLDLAMTELSTRAGVSQPTIARFCQALGCSGFREFKIRLAQSVAPGVSSVYRDVRLDEPAPGIIGKVFDRTIGALIEVRNSLSAGSVAEAIGLLSNASRIEFYGAGGSGIAAQDIQHKFFRLGVPSVAYSDPHTFSMSSALLGPHDVVVAISNTGRTRDIVDAARARVRREGRRDHAEPFAAREARDGESRVERRGGNGRVLADDVADVASRDRRHPRSRRRAVARPRTDGAGRPCEGGDHAPPDRRRHEGLSRRCADRAQK